MSSVAEAPEPTAAVEETEQTAEAPAAPEASSSPPSPADAESAAAGKDASAPTRPRDPATGRFVKADGSLASDAEQAAMEAATPPASPPPAATPPAPPAPAGEPITFRAAGQRYPIPGSAIDANGNWTIPAEQTAQIRQLLAEGVEYRTNWRKKEQDWKTQVESAGATERARAEKYNRAAVLMFERMANQEWLAAAANDPREVEYLRRELELELKSADLKAPRPAVMPAQQQDPAQQSAALEQAARATLEDEIELLLETPNARALYTSPDDRKALLARYQRRLNAYFTEHEGEIVLDRQILREDFEEEVTARQQMQKAAEDARKAVEFNARRNAPPPAAPPVVSTKAPPAVATTVNVPRDREDWRRRNGIS